ncbi:MAG: hypothetical protein IPK08_19005 [Bacteroidetes bacterium]|nr:hypothetical protein [Bacteroidota bacterium]
MFSFLLNIFSVCAYAETQAYKLDDAKIDMMFEQSTDVTANLMSGAAHLSFASFAAPAASSASAMVAEEKPGHCLLIGILSIGLGIHRFYMGTKTMTGVGYTSLPAVVLVRVIS